MAAGRSHVQLLASDHSPVATSRVGWSGLVMPISLTWASAENESRLACWFFPVLGCNA